MNGLFNGKHSNYCALCLKLAWVKSESWPWCYPWPLPPPKVYIYMYIHYPLNGRHRWSLCGCFYLEWHDPWIESLLQGVKMKHRRSCTCSVSATISWTLGVVIGWGLSLWNKGKACQSQIWFARWTLHGPWLKIELNDSACCEGSNLFLLMTCNHEAPCLNSWAVFRPLLWNSMNCTGS